MALRAVWDPTMERNQRPSVFSSLAKGVHRGGEAAGVDGVQILEIRGIEWQASFSPFTMRGVELRRICPFPACMPVGVWSRRS